MYVCTYVCACVCTHTHAHMPVYYTCTYTCAPACPCSLSVYRYVHTYMRDNPYRSLAASFCRHGRIKKPCVFPTRSLSTRALVPAS